MKNKPCISSRDVAREAGVSQATVSYVLNNTAGVKIKPETRQAVLEAVRKLNYHPNHIARGMKLNKTMSIGVVTDRNVTNFFFMKTLEGIKDGIQMYNYSITLIFNKSGEVSDMEFIRYYNSNRLDGIIFAFASLGDDTIDYMNEMDIPFVIVDTQPRGGNVYEVCTDHIDQIPQVVQYFKTRGVRSIGYAGPVPGIISDRRVEAFKWTAANQGFDVMDNHIVFSNFDDNEIKKAITSLLTENPRPQAILTGSPRFGLLAAKCALMHNIKIPDELRIVALGSSNFYEITHPSLSALEIPLYDMGFRSAEKLFDILNGREVEKTTVLPSELVIRDSS